MSDFKGQGRLALPFKIVLIDGNIVCLIISCDNNEYLKVWDLNAYANI
jgi:hypothetical protein